MILESLHAAFDEALESPASECLTRADRLAIALSWLIDTIADEFAIPQEAAIDEVEMLCAVARHMIRESALRPTFDELFQ